jgi:hypothetical protein
VGVGANPPIMFEWCDLSMAFDAGDKLTIQDTCLLANGYESTSKSKEITPKSLSKTQNKRCKRTPYTHVRSQNQQRTCIEETKKHEKLCVSQE